jgi:glycosyltransferase involved in cell wall biosynthesis
MRNHKHVVMLGTSFDTMGGISSVVNVYRKDGLFERFSIIYLTTHRDGTKLQKLHIWIYAWVHFLLLLFKRKIVLVHAHTASGMSFWRKMLFFFPAFLLGVPCLLHLHGGGFPNFYERSNRFYKSLIRFVFDHVDCIIVLSDSWVEWARSISKNPSVVRIYNPVELPPVVDFDLRESHSILFLGRLGEGKGTFDLLKAISRIVYKHQNLKLFLGGDGDLEQAEIVIQELGLRSNVEILGWVSGAEKFSLLERVAIYVLPSYAEGLPMSVLEAMAAGLPVISTPVGGIPEIITSGLEGWLIQPGDVNGLSIALDNLLSDKDRRRQMGAAARNKIKNFFSSEHILPDVEDIYRKFGVPAHTHN